jgi:hypothetical protein
MRYSIPVCADEARFRRLRAKKFDRGMYKAVEGVKQIGTKLLPSKEQTYEVLDFVGSRRSSFIDECCRVSGGSTV